MVKHWIFYYISHGSRYSAATVDIYSDMGQLDDRRNEWNNDKRHVDWMTIEHESNDRKRISNRMKMRWRRTPRSRKDSQAEENQNQCAEAKPYRINHHFRWVSVRSSSSPRNPLPRNTDSIETIWLIQQLTQARTETAAPYIRVHGIMCVCALTCCATWFSLALIFCFGFFISKILILVSVSTAMMPKTNKKNAQKLN